MKNPTRILAFGLALAGFATAHGVVVLSFGTPGGLPLATLAAPAVGATATLSVYYTSTTPISAAEVFTSFDRSTAVGTAATKLDNLVGLSAPVRASGVALDGLVFAGGANTAATPGGTARPYGLDIQGVTANSGNLAATATPAKLFDVTLTNLALAAGSSATLSFYTASAGLFTSQFFDDAADPVAVTGTSLVLTAAPVPEPASILALASGVAVLLRRRRKA